MRSAGTTNGVTSGSECSPATVALTAWSSMPPSWTKRRTTVRLSANADVTDRGSLGAALAASGGSGGTEVGAASAPSTGVVTVAVTEAEPSGVVRVAEEDVVVVSPSSSPPPPPEGNTKKPNASSREKPTGGG